MYFFIRAILHYCVILFISNSSSFVSDYKIFKLLINRLQPLNILCRIFLLQNNFSFYSAGVASWQSWTIKHCPQYRSCCCAVFAWKCIFIVIIDCFVGVSCLFNTYYWLVDFRVDLTLCITEDTEWRDLHEV